MMYLLQRGRSEPKVGQGGDSSEVEAKAEPWGRARRRPSSEVEVESEPWVGRGGDRLLRSSGGRAPGSGEAELPMAPEAGLGCC
jgi:hypothetical protein